jgi:alcohol dehydrogenase (cytochrome c)
MNSFHRVSLAQRVTLCIAFSLPLLIGLPAASARWQSGVYTMAQATRGQALYAQHCAKCHGQQLEGGSAAALAGSRFMAKWNGKSVEELFYITRTQMPYGAAGSLTAQQYIDIVAAQLRANGYNAGTRELPADDAALKGIKIQTQVATTAAITARAADASPAQAATNTTLANYPTQQELNAAASNSTDWLMPNHDYGGQRYVDLKQITPANAASLRPVCMYQPSDTKSFHANPLVYRGVLYFTTAGSTIAIDATTCRLKWRFDRKPKSIEVHPPNRGVALAQGRVVRATSDGYLYALDIESGKLMWERQIVNAAKNEGAFNMAPLVFEDLILLGLGISEQGVKGWMGAFKLADGAPVWRFNTVPDDGEPGAETWAKAESKLHGGGAVWSAISLDPEAGLLYIPVANPAPDFFNDDRAGANLYTNCMVVLNVRTGKMQWHYQTMPNDTHDWDLTQVSPLFTANVGGKTRKLVSVVGKDGLLHVLDRETKEHLYEVPVTTRLNADKPVTREGIRACPGVMGAVLWNGPAYNARTNMLYVPAVDWCGVFRKAAESRFIAGQIYMGGMYQGDPPDKMKGWLTAVDASTGKVVWQYPSAKPMLAAVTTTAGGVIFTGELTGDFLTLDAKTGKVLYRFYTGGPMNGGVMSYAINGKQYVAAASGSTSGFWHAPLGSSTIVVFALP